MTNLEPQRDGAKPTNKTILIVDDEAVMLEILGIVLRDEGYRVIAAANGKEALAVINREAPDIVLCDVMMPVLDGISMCILLEHDPAHCSIPIVLFSAALESRVKGQCKYDAFVSKPFDILELLSTIKRLPQKKAEAAEPGAVTQN